MDQATAIRSGEQLDLKVLDRYLRSQIKGLEGELRLKQFPGGASNLTYLVEYGNREFVLRRPPFGAKIKSGHDMGREVRVQLALAPVFPYVPKIEVLCTDQSVMDCDFYVMERLRGYIPRKNFPKELRGTARQTEKLCVDMIETLAKLHAIDWRGTEMAAFDRGEGYVGRQVNGWIDRYLKARTVDAAEFTPVIEWLRSAQPKDIRRCVIHNDYRFDNIVYGLDAPHPIVGILDWEMATIGDPLMDLGSSLAYWVQADDDPIMQMARNQPTHLPGMLTRDELVDHYCFVSGIQLESFVFYEVFGLFRLAGIIQQIYKRYAQGLTKDKRFALFGFMTHYLDARCRHIIKTKT